MNTEWAYITLADVSNQPKNPASLQKLSICEELLDPSFFWSHLLARRTEGMGLPLASFTLLSKSCFHFETASNVEPRVMSKKQTHPLPPYSKLWSCSQTALDLNMRQTYNTSTIIISDREVNKICNKHIIWILIQPVEIPNMFSIHFYNGS